MMGKRQNDFTFADIGFGNRIPRNSFWHKLRQWALENLDEAEFEGLFAQTGRPSVSPIYTFLALLIQLEKGYSDRELEEETRFDDRVKYAITAMRGFEGIDAVTLHDHRKRFIGSDIGRKLLVKTIENARDAGFFSEENHNVVDSFMVFGAAARQDTYTLLFQGIKMALNFAAFYEIKEKAVHVLRRDDYETTLKKPKLNWDDEGEKNRVLEELVTDALALSEFFRKELPEAEDIAEICTLLERIAQQDVDMDEDGQVKMSDGTAKDRIISTHDPEMRHGRKSKVQKSDGYKCSIITGGAKAQIVVGVDVAPANVPDSSALGTLIEQAESNRSPLDSLFGDSAYSKDQEFLESLKNKGIDVYAKLGKITGRKGFYSKDDFSIDTSAGIVTCPAGQQQALDLEKLHDREKGVVSFTPEQCKRCQQKEKCTASKKGRTISIHPYEDKLQKEREYQKTEEFKKNYAQRAHGERTISHMARGGGRKARYLGKTKVLFQQTLVAIKTNIKAVMGKTLQTVPSTG